MDNIILTYIKRGLTGLMLLVVATVFFTSCDLSSFRDTINRNSPSPENYQKEIEDCVKFEIAGLNVIINDYSDFENNLFVVWTASALGELYSYTWDKYCNRIDKFEEAMSDLRLNEEREDGYRSVLQKVSNTPNHEFQDLAKRILSEYNKTTVILSEYQQLATSSDIKVWQFEELNTGIFFRFISGEPWSCELDEESATRYLEKYIN